MGTVVLATADICDANAKLLVQGDLRILPPVFKIYGRKRVFSGPVLTLRLHDDSNGVVREILETKGEGRVLFIDGGGSMNCALLGGTLSALACSTGWAGIVVNGCVRDVDEMDGCDIGVRALASNPKKPGKKRNGEKHVAVTVGGTVVRDGEWLYADGDGIIVSNVELSV